MEDFRQPQAQPHAFCVDTAVAAGLDGLAFAMVLDIVGDRDYSDSLFDYRYR